MEKVGVSYDINFTYRKLVLFETWSYLLINMLPLSLLRGAINHSVLVELKNGETYNGQLMNVDNWMNLNLKDVICTSKDGEKFWKMGECYIRGSSIKYMRVPDEVAEIVKADMLRNKSSDQARTATLEVVAEVDHSVDEEAALVDLEEVVASLSVEEATAVEVIEEDVEITTDRIKENRRFSPAFLLELINNQWTILGCVVDLFTCIHSDGNFW